MSIQGALGDTLKSYLNQSNINTHLFRHLILTMRSKLASYYVAQDGLKFSSIHELQIQLETLSQETRQKTNEDMLT